MSPSSSSPSTTTELQDPSREWRFTWEAQSHIPTLRLFLFNPIKPTLQVTSLKADLIVEQFVLAVSFLEAEAETILRVPVPRVLIDSERPLQCRILSDHIEVKLVLLLPVDHPLVSEFDSLMSLSDGSDELRPLSVESDLKKLSALEEVHFYCRHCSTKLTSALRCFEEMPSVNWLDVADNWFGGCCCTFGGASEKLVMKYAKSYTFSPGLCLLSTTSVILCKDDLVGCEFPNGYGSKSFDFKSKSDCSVTKTAPSNQSEKANVACCRNQTGMPCINGEEQHLCPEEDNLRVKGNSGTSGKLVDGENFPCILPADNLGPPPEVRTDIEQYLIGCETGCCTSETVESNSDETNFELLENQKTFLNGFLGNGFMARSSGISKEIEWVEFLCPQCSCLLGAYPCSNGQAPLDGGIRLFKCHISTSLPVSGSTNLFSNYTLERMFTSQLLESAKDELSFRTVVKDLETNDSVLHVILLNPNFWCYSGSCVNTMKPTVKMNMHPSVKVLFTACDNDAEFGSRKLMEWEAKNQADEVFMLPAQVKELISTLELTNKMYPSSYKFMQGFLLSYMKR